MNFRTLVLAAASIGAVFAQGPQTPASVSLGAVVEEIRFDGIEDRKQAAILERIGVRTGDALSADTRQRIGRELNKGEKVGQTGMTFTYRPGSRPGTAILIISSGC
jgi:outer membrane protein assembly factor BamA